MWAGCCVSIFGIFINGCSWELHSRIYCGNPESGVCPFPACHLYSPSLALVKSPRSMKVRSRHTFYLVQSICEKLGIHCNRKKGNAWINHDKLMICLGRGNLTAINYIAIGIALCTELFWVLQTMKQIVIENYSWNVKYISI